MDRRHFLSHSISASAIALATDRARGRAKAELDELTIEQIQEHFKAGRLSSRSLTEHYVKRIHQLDMAGPRTNAVIELNPDAVDIADRLDRERKRTGGRGPIHGVPVLIKDNIDTSDRMITSAGSLALIANRAVADAFLVRRLRAAGAVILGKTNLSEWANFRSTHSVSGWSGRGGQTHNPYALDRNPSGSSSGTSVAVSANFCAAGVGTETDGSIVSPSSINGVVGVKPTVGLISRSGVIPISASQDTAGPIARSVRDAAILLRVLAAPDPEDAAAMPDNKELDYVSSLDARTLRGARIGVARRFFGFNSAVDKYIEDCLTAMKKEGVELVDPVDVPNQGKFGDEEYIVMLYEFKAGVDAYLARAPATVSVRSLSDVIAFNTKYYKNEMPWFGQDIMTQSAEKGPLTDDAYLKARRNAKRMAGAEGIDAAMDKHKLDALVAPTESPAWLTDLITGDHSTGGCSQFAAVAGYPHITVPAGFVHGLPIGISFFGRAWSEPALLGIAYGFEQVINARRAPEFLETLNLGEHSA